MECGMQLIGSGQLRGGELGGPSCNSNAGLPHMEWNLRVNKKALRERERGLELFIWLYRVRRRVNDFVAILYKMSTTSLSTTVTRKIRKHRSLLSYNITVLESNIVISLCPRKFVNRFLSNFLHGFAFWLVYNPHLCASMCIYFFHTKNNIFFSFSVYTFSMLIFSIRTPKKLKFASTHAKCSYIFMKTASLYTGRRKISIFKWQIT